MKRNYHNYYIKQFLRTLKEFDEYNQDVASKLFRYVYNMEGFNYAPHIFCINALSYLVANNKKHINMKRFYVNCVMEQYIKDLKKYLKNYKRQNKSVADYEIAENIKKFTLFSFLRQRFNIGEPSNDDYKMFFYNG